MGSNQSEIFEFLRETAGQRNSLVIPRIYIKITGSLDIALFLSQCIYWSDKGRKSGGWFWKTYQDWEDELMLSDYMVRKAVKWMKGRKLLETRVKKARGNPTVHYRVNIANVWKLLEGILRVTAGSERQFTATRRNYRKNRESAPATSPDLGDAVVQYAGEITEGMLSLGVYEEQKFARGERGNFDDRRALDG